MSFTVARYNNEIGYLIYVPNSPRLGFQTNTKYLTVLPEDLDSGDNIIPIPFYGNREAQVLKYHSNGAVTLKILGIKPNAKTEKIYATSKEITWYLIDTSKWSYENRSNAKLRYGLRNFEYIEYKRNI